MAEPQRVILALAYKCGPDPDIKKGADGHRDFFTAAELEKAAASFLKDGARQMGIQHADGTLGHAVVMESFCWPSDFPPVIDGVVMQNVAKGDWLIKAQLDKVSWRMVENGQLTGLSIQGNGKRVRANV